MMEDQRPMTDTKRLDEIADRAKKATEGPWIEDQMQVAHVTRGVVAVIPSPRAGGCFDCQANKTFIGHAREDIPYLLSALRTALDENARMREALAGYGKMDADLAIAEAKLREIAEICSNALPHDGKGHLAYSIDRIAALTRSPA